jgi:aminoglycoside/choline kinase family phosphotransferase
VSIAEKRSPDSAEQRERIDVYLGRNGFSVFHPRIIPLTGDASDRRYYRILTAHGAPFVLALHATAFDVNTLPFANVARLFERMPVPIPKILGHADDIGVLALEDLGDVTLQAHLGAATSSQHSDLYRQAVALIATIQKRGAELESPEYLPYRIAFDVDKLTWEMEFFIKHFIEAYRGVVISSNVRGALREEFSALIEELAAEPRVLCHRDYHSRNLMYHQDRLYIIDFQDARMGPDTYDLVSLLRDSYVDLTDSQVDELIAFFLALRGRGTGAGGADAQRFRERFDLMAFQRNLKALGTFGFQAATRANPVYIQYMPRTLTYARTNLERHARFGRLRELLAGVLHELR